MDLLEKKNLTDERGLQFPPDESSTKFIKPFVSLISFEDISNAGTMKTVKPWENKIINSVVSNLLFQICNRQIRVGITLGAPRYLKPVIRVSRLYPLFLGVTGGD